MLKQPIMPCIIGGFDCGTERKKEGRRKPFSWYMCCCYYRIMIIDFYYFMPQLYGATHPPERPTQVTAPRASSGRRTATGLVAKVLDTGNRGRIVWTVLCLLGQMGPSSPPRGLICLPVPEPNLRAFAVLYCTCHQPCCPKPSQEPALQRQTATSIVLVDS